MIRLPTPAGSRQRTPHQAPTRAPLRLVPGHAYFLDPLPTLGSEKRSDRVRARLRFELLPLLRDYVAERLCGGATEAVSGLADRVEARLLERA